MGRYGKVRGLRDKAAAVWMPYRLPDSPDRIEHISVVRFTETC